MKLDTITLRNFNTNLIRTALKLTETSTKNSLARETGLSVASCKTILDDLLKTGEVIEIELGAPTGGRPSRRFQYNFNFKYRLNIYVEREQNVERIFYSVHNLMNQEITSQTLYEPITVTNLSHIIQTVLSQYSNIDRCVISVPGVVRDNKIITCDIEQLAQSYLKDVIEDETGIQVLIENDVNTMAYGSLSFENNFESLVHLYFPDGRDPGMGFIVNDLVIRGTNNFAGEVKELPINNASTDPVVLQNNTNTFMEYIKDIIISINSMINPDIISLSVSSLSKEEITDLQNKLQTIEHIGTIEIKTDIHDTIVNGLFNIHEITERNQL